MPLLCVCAAAVRGQACCEWRGTRVDACSTRLPPCFALACPPPASCSLTPSPLLPPLPPLLPPQRPHHPSGWHRHRHTRRGGGPARGCQPAGGRHAWGGMRHSVGGAAGWGRGSLAGCRGWYWVGQGGRCTRVGGTQHTLFFAAAAAATISGWCLHDPPTHLVCLPQQARAPRHAAAAGRPGDGGEGRADDAEPGRRAALCGGDHSGRAGD